MKLNIKDNVSALPGIGKFYVDKLNYMQIITIDDLIYHIPRKYVDSSKIETIEEVSLCRDYNKELFTIVGTVLELKKIYTRNGKKLVKGILSDETGTAELVWFNQDYILQIATIGCRMIISGKADYANNVRPKFVSPKFELIFKDKLPEYLGKIYPLYPETLGINSKWLSKRISFILETVNLVDWLPKEIINSLKLMPLSQALKEIHLPTCFENIEKAKERISFDEFLRIEIALHNRKEYNSNLQANVIKSSAETIDNFTKSLPFTLTDSQKKSINEILIDLRKPSPMIRLLTGETGSGKTVVAAAAIYHTYNSGLTSIFMAPTTILAKQHFDNLSEILEKSGIKKRDIALVTSSEKFNEKARIFIGTHSLLNKKEIIENASLSIIDEQHKFGVLQREKLFSNNNNARHLLNISATPIPRTLALSIFSDINISTLSPIPGRTNNIRTFIVNESQIDGMYQFIKDESLKGNQSYIICPIINELESNALPSAIKTYQYLQEKYFKDIKTSLLHGNMKNAEKDFILSEFKSKEIMILISTSVVEVGIDIRDAIIVVITGAEHFGLATLHQLRGRVGRGVTKSYCFLVPSDKKFMNSERLKYFSSENDGYKIAEYDLKNRGAGEIYGLKQAGIIELKIADISNLSIINKSRKALKLMISAKEQYKEILSQYIASSI